MAATRLISLHVNKGKTVAQCLADRTNYSENKDKTNNGEFISSYGCDPKTCDEEFFLAKREYQQKTGRSQERDVIAYQIRQSFKPGEVTPEEANRIGYELAMRLTKGKHAFIVATHIDKAHIHNHIIFNSTTIDCERKFKNFFLSGRAVQRISDLLCAENSLSVIVPRKYSDRDKYENEKYAPSMRDSIRQAIDEAMEKKPKSMEELLSYLLAEGFEIKRGKHLAIKTSFSKRFLRFDSLGEGYTEQNLRDAFTGKENHRARKKPEFNLILDLQKIISSHKGIGYERWAANYNLKQYAKTICFLKEHGICSLEKLYELTDTASTDFDKISSSIRSKEKRLQEITELRKQIIGYVRTREVYVAYRKVGYSKKFFEAHREEIQIHKAAKDTFNQLGLKKLPTIKELNEEYTTLLSQKRLEYTAYKAAKNKMQAYVIARKNVEDLMKIRSSENERDHQQPHIEKE